jgi:hypothetical protein
LTLKVSNGSLLVLQLYDNDNIGKELMGTATTNANGEYKVTLRLAGRPLARTAAGTRWCSLEQQAALVLACCAALRWPWALS